jgi:hypothetical protein
MRDHREEVVMIEDEEGIEVFWDGMYSFSSL